MNRPTPSIQERLNALRAAYTQRLPEYIRPLEEAKKALQRGGWDSNTLKTLHRHVHHLAGSGTTFGYSAMSHTAHELENLLYLGLEDRKTLTAEQRTHILELLDALREAGLEASRNGHAQPAAAGADPAPEQGEEGAPPPPLPERAHRAPYRHVFLVEDDPEQAQYLAMLIEHAGYRVHSFARLDAFKRAFLEAPPAATIISMVFAEGALAGAEVFAELQQSRLLPLPVIFTSARDDIKAQLGAVQARGTYYFTKPVDATRLIDALDELTAPLCRAQVQDLIEQAVREAVRGLQQSARDRRTTSVAPGRYP